MLEPADLLHGNRTGAVKDGDGTGVPRVDRHVCESFDCGTNQAVLERRGAPVLLLNASRSSPQLCLDLIQRQPHDICVTPVHGLDHRGAR